MAHKRDKPGKSCCKCVLQKTMKGADKAIVAKSFGKWKSSSLRSRTMEKPDEPSEESEEESPSNCTCEALQLGKKPVGKSTLSSRLKSIHAAVCLSLRLFVLCANVNYYCGDYLIFFLSILTLWPPPYPVNKQTTLLGRRIPFEAKCVSDDTELPGKKTKQKIANTKTVTGAWEKERSE